jgi:hypothetical protein
MSRRKKYSAAALLAILTLAAAGTALAHGPRGRVSFGIHFGLPVWPAWHYRPAYYPPVYYPERVVYVREEPTVYVERPATAVPAPIVQPAPQANPQAAAPESWWYYCAESAGYYPYVQSCAGGWQRVAPRPTN